VYALTDRGVYWSINGLRWSQIKKAETPDNTFYDLASSPQMPTTLYLSTNYGLFRSLTGGLSWSLFSADLNDGIVLRMVVNPVWPWRLYAGVMGDGVFTNRFGSSVPSQPTVSQHDKDGGILIAAVLILLGFFVSLEERDKKKQERKSL
jgi:hypothetical protein